MRTVELWNRRTLEPWNLEPFPQLEADEAGDGDVLAELGDRRLDQLADGQLRVADRGLVEQADLLVEAVQLTLDDLLDHLRGLVLHLVPVDGAFALESVGGYFLAS